jgi:hypothetical protein
MLGDLPPIPLIAVAILPEAGLASDFGTDNIKLFFVSGF